MSGSAPTIIKLRQLFPGLKGNNRRIAEQLLTSPELLMSKKVNDIAEACSCDPAQASTCQQQGREKAISRLNGFPDVSFYKHNSPLDFSSDLGFVPKIDEKYLFATHNV